MRAAHRGRRRAGAGWGAWACAVLLALLAACPRQEAARQEGEAAGGRTRLVFVLQPMGGLAGPLRAHLDAFERAHPGVEVVTQLLPNASDLAHQYFLTSLEGGSTDFDVLVADVVWVPEFARAGWVADLSADFPPARLRGDFLLGPVEAVLWEGRTWAVPWFLDVGMLFYRTDLVPRAPRTYAELERFTREAFTRSPGLQGYVWQGLQYEGLSCNVYEALWGHGGEATTLEGRVLLQTPAMHAALAYLHGLLATGVSPPSVTTMSEEEARRAFQQGRAVFMRNWPYAWVETQKEGSPTRGKVGVAPLPSVDGRPGPGALGGYQLAVNAHVPPARRRLATELVRHLTSPEANRMLALDYGRLPARRDVYAEPELKEGAPFIASLLPEVERARPRPVTPYYLLLADILQSEFSAAVAGLRSPEEAMQRAQRLVDQLTEEAR